MPDGNSQVASEAPVADEGNADRSEHADSVGPSASADATEPVTLGPTEWATDAPARTPPIAEEPPDGGFDDERWYLNRELSELSFQWRVLYEALDERQPPLERLRFLSILSRNLDEFFMKRIGGLKQQIDAGVTASTVDGRTPESQWSEALEMASDLVAAQSRCYQDAVRRELDAAGIELVDAAALSDSELDTLRSYFESSVLPTLTPLTFDPAHPFPFISNLSLSLAVLTREEGGEERFSRIKIPANLPRVIPLSNVGTAIDELEGDPVGRYVPIEEVIEANLDLVFPNVEITHCATFRVTRNAEVRRNEDVAEGLIEQIEDVLRQRRFATIVRLEIEADADESVRELLTAQLDITDAEVFEVPSPIALGDFDALCELDAPSLELEPWTPRQHPRFAEIDTSNPAKLFDAIRDRPVLVHHPYHTFDGTVQSFLDAAAHDSDTLAIKVAIYRTAPDSRVLQSLIDAAKNGKQVAVLVELKARFDEENNLRWVKRLEEEGIHVAYGSIGLKIHSKVALAVRQEADDVRIYSHVSTGNYHSETAKGYVDLGLFTADADIGQDIVRLFNSFTGHSRQQTYRKLLVAPETLRDRLCELIEREISHAESGGEGRILAKMNALEDPDVVRKLYEAGEAGVEIDLFVRDICRLRPGVDGVSDTIRVHSLVGRFLEHSRIVKFGNGGDPAYFVGSADWMTRNLDRRIEAVAPVEDADLQSELDEIFETLLADNRRRWVMRADGSYVQRRPGDDPVRDTQEVLMKRARERDPGESRRPDREPHREPNIDLDEVYTDENDR
ncbi:polyphosphate kinase 1 [Halobellus sp. GM3]|uniref:polyphosphate kinase 1 n=1 Tax=Halobellus sp. GM3 TaxID=3458410 RepID=UPI00403DA1AA